MDERENLTIIDGKSVFYRGYYAMGHLSLPDGTPTGGVYGFASMLIEIIELGLFFSLIISFHTRLCLPM